MDVGVTIYATVPEIVLLGLARAWLMVAPDPALAPVIPLVMAPTVQVKVLGTLAVSEIFGPEPLQAIAVAELVTIGLGSTDTVMI